MMNFLRFVFLFSLSLFAIEINSLQAQENPNHNIQISSVIQPGSLPLISTGKTTVIYEDSSEATVVNLATSAFKKDVQSVTGVELVINKTNSPIRSLLPLIIGTIGQSVWVDQLMQHKQLDLESIKGKWETFVIAVIDHPYKNIEKALVIIGSDSRATAFGIFELSKMMGVSPWCWWADVIPEHKNALYVTAGNKIVQSPSVQYRGIFLNDEDWGLQPWAAKMMDPDIKDIGPRTYEHIFELLLRLKANYIWPAMHPCTKAFYYYPENAKLANDYSIIIGTSHCEPMLRNNVFEWSENYKNEYHQNPGEWRYDLNKEQIYTYWQDRIKQVKNYQSVITVGMRGVHDGSMPGPKDIHAKVKLLENIISDQRSILQNIYQKAAIDIPQIFCPYKEVLQLYRTGLKLPDDITIVWADDNFGYITQLSDSKEQQRTGGSGVYYHLSYWGSPHDYLWLSSNSPSLISYEMSKAYHFNARRLWVFNVGDIKPAEMEINFSMDLAWNIEKWNPNKANEYTAYWAGQTFGEEFAKEIADIKNEYYLLAQQAKPEHINVVSFTELETSQRLKRYHSIMERAIALAPKMPARLKDAYFELIEYPVMGACLMNEKVLYAQRSLTLAKRGDTTAVTYSKKAIAAFKQIQEITYKYNKQVAGGKWDGIMSWHPRDQEVFKMPFVATEEMIHSKYSDSVKTSIHYAQLKEGGYMFLKDSVVASLPATDFIAKKEVTDRTIEIIKGLGITKLAVTVLPYTAMPLTKDQLKETPYLEYKITIAKGRYAVVLKCLPTNNINSERPAVYAVSVNNDEPQFVNISSEKNNWSKNVINGFSKGRTVHDINVSGETTIRIYLPCTGVVINRLEIICEGQ